MKRSKRATLPLGGFVLRPPDKRKEAGEILGKPISDDLWHDIENAYAEFGRRLDALDASKNSRNKADPKSWHVRQSSSVGGVEGAIGALHSVIDKHREFLTEASANYCLQEHGRTLLSQHNAYCLLHDALENLNHAAAILERARPLEVETPTEQEAKRLLVKRLFNHLREHGHNPTTTDGRSLPPDASESELAPFERFIAELGIHDAETPSAHSRWVQRALEDKT